MNDPGRVLILGAGPTGLGAAYRLTELGIGSFSVLEARSGPGGLASSHVDAKGFTWDTGGHVQFSHYDYYDRVLDRALGDSWLHHERQSWIWFSNRWVPYPFQNNLHRLDPGDRDRALAGLEQAAARRESASPENFRDWIEATFGFGLADLFFVPYNAKVWGYPLESLDTGWIGERVAVPDIDRIRRSIAENRDDVSWGPNRRFRFPLRGGTGAIWSAVARLLDPAKLHYGVLADRIDLDGRTVHARDGRRWSFDTLVTTIPLDVLCRASEGLDAGALRAADALKHSSIHILGVGLERDQPDSLRGKCWMYFPEGHSPYYRVTVFSNYSPHHVPAGSDSWSLMAEVCESPSKPVDVERLRTSVLDAMTRDGLIGRSSRVVSFWHCREEHGYPTPFLGRDRALGPLLTSLTARRIYSRGRFGAWKYEVSNQDHSFMQGVEAVDHAVGIGEEDTLNRPEWVNSGVLSRPPGSRDAESS